jgi:hypothetical protein
MITQRLVNTYPSWSKIRKDPSSFGFRYSSVAGEHFDFVYSELKQNYLSFQLLKEGLGLEALWQIDLSKDDYILSTSTTGGSLSWAYPQVVGDLIALERIESLEELYWSLPTRIGQQEVFTSDFIIATKTYLEPPVINTMSVSSRLRVRITNSTNWFKRTSFLNRLEPGIHRVVIEGYDINGDLVREHLDVLDDGDYFTRNIFSEILDVDSQGFDGDITLDMYSDKVTLEDPFHFGISDSGLEGPLYLELSNNLISNTGEIAYYTTLVKQGENYKDGMSEIPYNREDLWVQALFDSSGDEIEVVDITINPNTTRLYALDSSGNIHIYEYGLQRFTPPTQQDSLTKATYIDIDATQPWASYGQTLMMFTRFNRPRFPVSSVQIKRISPSGIINYLQADKTWSVSNYSFPGDPNAKGLFENTFKDITFDNEFDEYGQWEFYCTTNTVHDTTVSYTGVMVDSLTALTTLSTGLDEVVSINYSHDNYLVVAVEPLIINDPYTLYKYKEYSDVFLADEENQSLFFREEYANIEVSY